MSYNRFIKQNGLFDFMKDWIMAKKSTVKTPQPEVVETPQPEVAETPQPEVVETPQPETPQPETQIAKPKVGERCKQLILEGILDNKGILEQIKKEYPGGKTSMACIAWYKSDLKKKKVDPDQGYKDWLKANEARLKAEYEATLVQEVA